MPIKNNSERLPSKNTRLFAGEPLCEYKFKQIKDVKFDKVVVSNESPYILAKARNYGFDTHKRDPKYSTQDIPMSDVYKYICSEVDGDDIAWVNVTNPLVTSDVYNIAIQEWKHHEKKYDCLLSVYELQKYVFWKGKPLNWTPTQHPRSQDLEGLIAMNFAINIRPRKDIIKEGSLIGKKPYFLFLPELMSTKIDYEWQLTLCEKYA